MKRLILILFTVLNLLFWKAIWLPSIVQASNDGPLGQMNAEQSRPPSVYYGTWADLNWLGNNDVTPPMNVSAGLRMFFWYVSPGCLIVLNIIGLILILKYEKSWDRTILHFVGYVDILTIIAIIYFIVKHELGYDTVDIEQLPVFGCSILFFSIITIFTLRPDL